jgi:uncharacterized cupin superfamily protein
VGAAVSHYDEMGDGVFRKVRRELGVQAFGVNVLVLPPGVDGPLHVHERQDELYFVHAGAPSIVVDGDEHPLRPGSLAHLPAGSPRRLRNPGCEPAVLLIVGGQGGYVAHDARVLEH